MLSGLNQLVAHCYQRAAQCSELATRTDDLERRAYLLERERSWLLLARSYEISDSTTLFLDEVRRRIFPKPLRQKFPTCSSCYLEMEVEVSVLSTDVIFVCPNCHQMGVAA